MATLVFSYKGAAGREVRLAEGRTTLGRRPYNDVVLIHPTVSGEHAVLQLDGGQARIEDMGSTNGTWVNGVRVQQQVLATGDHIALGACRARFVANEETDVLPAAACRFPIGCSLEVRQNEHCPQRPSPSEVTPANIHRNARLTPIGQAHLAKQIELHGWPALPDGRSGHGRSHARHTKSWPSRLARGH